MANTYFHFKQFTVNQDKCAMKVTTDACLFGAYVADKLTQLLPNRILEIGTGTGLLSLMIAQKNNSIQIDTIEIEPAAFEQATENICNSNWKAQINPLLGNATTYPFTQKYDAIVCNPPFYENDLIGPGKEKNIAHHSTQINLNQVLLLIEKLLLPNGTFHLLLPMKRYEEIKIKILAQSLFITSITMVRQSVQHNHFRVILTGSRASLLKESKNEIAIKELNQAYTQSFSNLLKDYYLEL